MVIFVVPALNAVMVIWLPEIDAVAIDGFVLPEMVNGALTEADTTEFCPGVKMRLV